MGDAVFLQRNGTYALVIAGKCGIFGIVELIELLKYLREIGAEAVKLTTRQTLILLVKEEHLESVRSKVEELGLKVGEYGNIVRSVKGCVGSLCSRSVCDAHELGVEIQDRYMGQPVPKDFKIAVSGCLRGCTDPYCADFGLIGVGGERYDVVIGGRGGSRNPVPGRVIIEGISRGAVFAVLDYVLEKYRELAQPHERLVKTIERVGIEKLMPPESVVSREGSGDFGVEAEFLEFLNS